MINNFGWMQLLSSDTKQSQNFYGQLFDWSLEPQTKTESETAVLINAGEGMCAGIAQNDINSPPQWVPYVNVADINTYTEKAKKLGAEVIIPITDIGEGQGFYSVFKDPSGALLGIWGPK